MGIVKGQAKPAREIFVGYAELYPVAFNPTASDLSEAYGREVTNEPSYMNDEGEVSLRVLAYFIFEGKKHYVNLRITNGKEEVVTYNDPRTGDEKTLYMTPKGFAFPGTSEDAIRSSSSYGWTDTSTLVPALKGEADFYRMMIAWMRYNQNSDDNVDLRTMYEKVLKGDMLELNTVINDDSEQGLKGFTIPVVLTERNGYQDYYNQKFPWGNGETKPVLDHRTKRENDGKYYSGRADWGNLGQLQRFDITMHKTFSEHLADQEDGEVSNGESVTGGFM